MYEVLRSRFVRKSDWVEQFEKDIKRLTISFIDDAIYKKDAFRATLRASTIQRRPISLVDMVIRYILEDDSVRVNCLVTANDDDFKDVCLKKKLTLLSF